eukprot:maker-scaffold_29-snap-gene-1.7-mRNA-1 protein AED:0.39 eAED:0.51 QI:0/0/0/1/0/0/3/0/104
MNLDTLEEDHELPGGNTINIRRAFHEVVAESIEKYEDITDILFPNIFLPAIKERLQEELKTIISKKKHVKIFEKWERHPLSCIGSLLFRFQSFVLGLLCMKKRV